MPEILCTACGAVGASKDGACAKCGSRDALPAGAPSARKFIEARAAQQGTKVDGDAPSVRAEVTGKVLGRALGKLLGK